MSRCTVKTMYLEKAKRPIIWDRWSTYDDQLRQMSLFQVMLGIPLLEGASPASCFPRIAFGYDAVCYSYIWSEV
jgi:thimet oligopeptidase